MSVKRSNRQKRFIKLHTVLCIQIYELKFGHVLGKFFRCDLVCSKISRFGFFFFFFFPALKCENRMAFVEGC